jgi:hypothetical protein
LPGALGQIAVGRIQPQQAKGLARDDRIHQVGAEAMIDELPRMAGALGAVLDGEGRDPPTPEDVRGFGDRHAFAGAGIENARWNPSSGPRACGNSVSIRRDNNSSSTTSRQ